MSLIDYSNAILKICDIGSTERWRARDLWTIMRPTSPDTSPPSPTPPPPPSPTPSAAPAVPPRVFTTSTKAIRADDFALLCGTELVSKLLENRLLVNMPLDSHPDAADARIEEMTSWLHENISNPFVVRDGEAEVADMDILFSEVKDLLYFKLRFEATT